MYLSPQGLRCALLVVVTLLAPTASRAGDKPPASPRESADLAIQARGILDKYCIKCHDGGEKSRGTLVALDHRKLVATVATGAPNPVPFIVPKVPGKSQIIRMLEDGSMPPVGKPRPTEEELKTLRAWIEDGAPPFPASYDDKVILDRVLDDVAKLSKPEDAKFIRYISLAHLIRDKQPASKLREEEGRLHKALRLVSHTPPAEGKPLAESVDETATLFRIDVRKLGWDTVDLFVRTPAKGAVGGVFPLTPYDVVLLEYPHGSVSPKEPRLTSYLDAAKMVRPVPYIRGDWFSGAVLTGDEVKGSPFGRELKSLSELSKAYNEAVIREVGQWTGPCGAPVRAFGGRNPVPPAPKPESGKPILALSAWHSGDVQADPPPFTLSAEVVDADDRPNELKSGVEAKQPFQLKVSASVRLKYTLLVVYSNGEIHVQPTNLSGQLLAEKNLLTPKNGLFKIDSVLTGEASATEYFVLLASETPLPPVKIVQSRHLDHETCLKKREFPVRRILFDLENAPEGFDESRVVRRVIPVTVRKASE